MTQGYRETGRDRRLHPSLFQYDYLVLDRLARDVSSLIQAARVPSGGLAIDVGSADCPYRPLLESRGLTVKTLDIEDSLGADLVGTAAATGLDPQSIDLILCTQVLEHVDDPGAALREFHRVLKPGGAMVVSVPQAWFYHPHPHDYWRFTAEGLRHLCTVNGFLTDRVVAQGGTVLATAQVINFSAFGLLGSWGGPVYAALNLLANLSDPLVKNELFPINLACLAYRDGQAASAGG